MRERRSLPSNKLAINVGFAEARGVTELTSWTNEHPAIVDHRGRLRLRRATMSMRRIYNTTDGRAPTTIAISREYDRDEDEGRRRRGSADDRGTCGGQIAAAGLRARRAAGEEAQVRPFVVEPEGTIQQPVVGDLHRDRGIRDSTGRGLLFQLTTALSTRNLKSAPPCREPSASARTCSS